MIHTTYRDRISQLLHDEALRQHPSQSSREIRTSLMKYYHEVLDPENEAQSKTCMEEVKKVMNGFQDKKDANGLGMVSMHKSKLKN
jgi:hypothetical protein